MTSPQREYTQWWRGARCADSWSARNISAARTSDIVLATTEICTNAVPHAYAEGDGVFQIEARLSPECVIVIVRDHGGEQRAPVAASGGSLVAALADAIEIDAIENVGTEVRMTFNLLDSH